MTEIEAGGNTYRIGQLTAKQQLHIARRLMPVLWAGAAVAKVEHDKVGEFDDSTVMNVFSPVVKAIGEMTDENAEYVMDTCLSVCHRRQGDAWATVIHQNGRPMFEDMGLQETMKVVMAVVQENLGNFFAALLTQ